MAMWQTLIKMKLQYPLIIEIEHIYAFMSSYGNATSKRQNGFKILIL